MEAMLSVFLTPMLCRVPTCTIMGTGSYLREPQAMGGLDLICLVVLVMVLQVICLHVDRSPRETRPAWYVVWVAMTTCRGICHARSGIRGTVWSVGPALEVALWGMESK